MIDAIVTGQSLPALQSALDLAEVGLKVAVLTPEKSDSFEPSAERDPEGSIAEFITRIAEAIEQADRQPASNQGAGPSVRRELPTLPLLYKRGEWLEQSSPAVLGVPAVPLASENIALLGTAGSFRAYLDRIIPLLTIGKTQFFGQLVRTRMGAKLREGLVDPQVFERFGAVADEVEVAIAAPGLNEALSRSGALSSAVLAYSDRNVARETRVSPAQGPAGFHRAIIQRLELYGVEVHESHLVSVESQEEGWVAQLGDGSSLRSRTLIVDLDRSPVANPAVRELVEGIMPSHARVHAVIDMELPAWLTEGMTAVALIDDWSVFYESIFGSEYPIDGAELSRSHGRIGRVRAASRVGNLEELTHVLGRIAQTKRLPLSSDAPGFGPSRDALVHSASLAAAPFLTVADRTEAVAAIAQKELDFPTLLSVGRTLHGDDQGAALASAHKATVRLRRRLLGLEG